MRNTPGYQDIVDEGRVERRAEGELREARRMVARVGNRRLGAATGAVEARLETITSLAALETLVDRIFEVETWDELLSPASPGA